MFLAVLLACVDVALTQNAVCDGAQQPAERDGVDSSFDADDDGFFDGSNPGCIATYAEDKLDCGDRDPGVHPGAAEVTCNGVDDDCDAETPDGTDGDGDGATACDDCADADPAIRPGISEISCNGVDDDCDADTPDGAPDECDFDYSGTWDLGAQIKYRCASGAVSIDFTQLTIADAFPNISIRAVGSSQPGNMTGTRNHDGDVTVERTITGSCDETYSIVGSFTSETAFSGTFYADFTGSYCGNCSSQSYPVTATR